MSNRDYEYDPDHPLADKSPEGVLKLQLVPPNMTQYVPEHMRPPPPTSVQKDRIRTILRMGRREPFHRCKGKDARMLKKLEAQGDFTHHDKKHKACPECQCRNKAGEGTRGDFYGLGWGTGTLGVGYCRFCIQSNHIGMGHALAVARHEVKCMQQYGEAKDDGEYGLIVASEEAALATQRTKVRKSLTVLEQLLDRAVEQSERGKKANARMVRDLEEIAEWVRQNQGNADKKTVESTLRLIGNAILNEHTLTKYEKGELVPWSDQEKFDNQIKAARALTKDAMDGKRMGDVDDALVDAMVAALSEFEGVVTNALRRVHELTVAKQVRGEDVECGTTPPPEYVRKTLAKNWKTLIRKVQLARTAKGKHGRI